MNCEICNKNIKKTTFLDNNKIFYCDSCKHYFCDAIENNSEFTVYEEYEYLLKPLRDKNFSKILIYLSRVLPQNSVGLEVGSALGWFLQKCTDIGYSMTGIEPIKCNYEKSISGGLNVVNGYFPDVLSIEDNTSKFDFIIFNDVLEHIPDSQKTLITCKKLLKDDGFLIINLPIDTGIFFRIASLLALIGRNKSITRLWQFETESPHLHYFSSKSLNRITKDNGFFIASEFSLDTVDLNFSNNYRRVISVGDNGKLYAWILALILFVSTPLMKVLPRDTKCFVFKKGSNK